MCARRPTRNALGGRARRAAIAFEMAGRRAAEDAHAEDARAEALMMAHGAASAALAALVAAAGGEPAAAAWARLAREPILPAGAELRGAGGRRLMATLAPVPADYPLAARAGQAAGFLALPPRDVERLLHNVAWLSAQPQLLWAAVAEAQAAQGVDLAAAMAAAAPGPDWAAGPRVDEATRLVGLGGRAPFVGVVWAEPPAEAEGGAQPVRRPRLPRRPTSELRLPGPSLGPRRLRLGPRLPRGPSLGPKRGPKRGPRLPRRPSPRAKSTPTGPPRLARCSLLR